LKRIHSLKKEKENLLQQVENEEEYLTNMLNKQVSKVSLFLKKRKKIFNNIFLFF